MYVSADGKNWGDPMAAGTFKKDRSEKNVLFEKTCEGRFIRFVALSGFDGQMFTSIAELDIIPVSEK